MIRITVTAALVLLVSSPSQAARYIVAGGDGGSSVEFLSKAPMESFEGKTSSVSGAIVLDPADLGEEIDIEIAVDMASLNTGISLRNRHMRENHLHTDEFPSATFRGGTLLEGDGASLLGGEAHSVILAGEMTLHGVTKEITVPLELSHETGEGAPRIRIEGQFPVKLSDYGIPRPKFLIMKLGDEQRVTVHLVAVTPE